MQQDEKEEKMWKVESSEKMQKNVWTLLDTKMIFPNFSPQMLLHNTL